MAQKYKFFIKTKVVTCVERDMDNDDNMKLDQLIEIFDDLRLEDSIQIEFSDLENAMIRLREKVSFIQAGGGYVLNPAGQLLMIHRRGFWDLPKGKLEKGEDIKTCAIREVEEECGVIGPQITSGAFITYHVYVEKGQTLVKESHWFAMKLSGVQDLQPQIEEDITEAVWLDLPIEDTVKDGSYSSVLEVLNHFGTSADGASASST